MTELSDKSKIHGKKKKKQFVENNSSQLEMSHFVHRELEDGSRLWFIRKIRKKYNFTQYFSDRHTLHIHDRLKFLKINITVTFFLFSTSRGRV